MTDQKVLDRAWGYDRYENSATYKQLLVDRILLKKNPGLVALEKLEESMVGIVAHEDEVEIVDEINVDGFAYAKVRCTKYPTLQEGWLRTTMLRNMGKNEIGIKDW